MHMFPKGTAFSLFLAACLISGALIAADRGDSKGTSTKSKVVAIGGIERVSETYNYVILPNTTTTLLECGDKLLVGKVGDTGQLSVSRVYKRYVVAEIVSHPKQKIEVGSPVRMVVSKTSPDVANDGEDGIGVRLNELEDKKPGEIDTMEIIQRRRLVILSVQRAEKATKFITGKEKNYIEAVAYLVTAEKMLLHANGHHPKLAEIRKTLADTYSAYANHLLTLAQAQLKQGKFAEAKANAEKAVLYNPGLKPEILKFLKTVEGQKGK